MLTPGESGMESSPDPTILLPDKSNAPFDGILDDVGDMALIAFYQQRQQ
jgi:hypothetical protein